MKKLILFLFILLPFLKINAQSVLITPGNQTTTNAAPDLVLRSSSFPDIRGVRSSGSISSPTAVNNGSNLLRLRGSGFYNTTSSSDQAAIDFVADELFTLTARGTTMRFSTTPKGSTGLTEWMRLDHNGYLGIGTSAPAAKLDVANSSSGDSDASLRLLHSTSTAFNRLNFENLGRTGKWIMSGNVGSAPVDSRWHIYHTTTGNILSVTGDGKVGIDVSSPSQKLNIRDGNILLETGTVDKVYIQANGGNSAGEITINASNGNKSIEMRGSDALNKAGEILMYDPTTNLKTLEIDGDWGSTGKSRIVVDELQITGGADFAEYFNMVEDVIPEVGTVLSVSSNGSANLEISSKPYDSNVVGVLSGANGINPGIMLKQKDSKITNGDYPVAISGRVYVKAEATKNKIKPGDLLTSSNKAGFAMKATNKKKYAGAIIGKALTGLSEEEGFVLVLLGVK